MSAPTTAPELLALIRGSGVLDSYRLEAFLAEHPAVPDSAQALTTALIEAGLLTLFQAERLLQGKSRGFVLGGYRVLERLGTGGSQVFLGEHQTTGRRVALRILPLETCQDPLVVERFRREARAVARLDHPNIVRAHDIGSMGKLHFLIMEYVEGMDLQTLVERSGHLSPARAAQYGRQAAQALQYVHQAGLIHRDIEPSNLLLDRSGAIKLAGLGMARYCHDKVDPQQRGASLLGALDYLSPEQAEDSLEVDIRSDIYSLGATLYFLLVGHPPFQPSLVAKKSARAQMQKPEDVHQLRPEVPEGLAAVLRRMMAQHPGQRYQTPQEVVTALLPWETEQLPTVERNQRLLHGEPHPPARVSHGGPHPRVHAAQSVPVEPKTNGTLSPVPVAEEEPAPEEDRPARVKPKGNRAKAARALRAGKQQPEAVRAAPTPSTNGRPAWHPEPHPVASRGWGRLVFFTLCLGCVGIAAGGLLWYGSGRLSSALRQKTVVETPESEQAPGLVHTFTDHTSQVEAVAWSPDGAKLVSGSENGELFLWNMRTRAKLRFGFPPVPGGVSSLAWSPDGRFVVTGGQNGNLTVWVLENRTPKRVLVEEGRGVFGVAFMPDSLAVVDCSHSGPVRLWDLETGTCVPRCGKPPQERSWLSVAVSADGKYVLAGAEDGFLCSYDARTGAEVRRFKGHQKSVCRVAFSPKGEWVASCGADGQVILWETETGQEVRRFQGHKGMVEWVGFSPDGRTLVTTEGSSGSGDVVGADQGFRLWDVSNGKELCRFGNIPDKVLCAAFSPDGSQVAVGCGDKKVRVYQVGKITAPNR
jgi:WD40 repeat protein/serine/threonine protein kinase